MPEITPLMLVSFVLFFLLGFLFYAALYAAIGAAVNTVQEAQSLVFPVMLPDHPRRGVLPRRPRGAGRRPRGHHVDDPGDVAAHHVPEDRGAHPALWQIALSIALLVLGILGVVWVAARVYRVGILMYGKKPTFPELMKWVRHS